MLLKISLVFIAFSILAPEMSYGDDGRKMDSIESQRFTFADQCKIHCTNCDKNLRSRTACLTSCVNEPALKESCSLARLPDLQGANADDLGKFKFTLTKQKAIDNILNYNQGSNIQLFLDEDRGSFANSFNSPPSERELLELSQALQDIAADLESNKNRILERQIKTKYKKKVKKMVADVQKLKEETFKPYWDPKQGSLNFSKKVPTTRKDMATATRKFIGQAKAAYVLMAEGG